MVRIRAPSDLVNENVDLFGNVNIGFGTTRVAFSVCFSSSLYPLFLVFPLSLPSFSFSLHSPLSVFPLFSFFPQTETDGSNLHLRLNQRMSVAGAGFAQGILVNENDVFVRRENNDGTGAVRVGIGKTFAAGNNAMLEVVGGVRAGRGRNSLLTDDFGFSFVTNSRTGMFRDASDEHLYLKVNNVDRLSILDPGNRLDVGSNMRVTGSEFDLFSLLALSLVDGRCLRTSSSLAASLYCRFSIALMSLSSTGAVSPRRYWSSVC